jgi:hypothetical protein
MRTIQFKNLGASADHGADCRVTPLVHAGTNFGIASAPVPAANVGEMRFDAPQFFLHVGPGLD